MVTETLCEKTASETLNGEFANNNLHVNVRPTKRKNENPAPRIFQP